MLKKVDNLSGNDIIFYIYYQILKVNTYNHITFCVELVQDLKGQYLLSSKSVVLITYCFSSPSSSNHLQSYHIQVLQLS